MARAPKPIKPKLFTTVLQYVTADGLRFDHEQLAERHAYDLVVTRVEALLFLLFPNGHCPLTYPASRTLLDNREDVFGSAQSVFMALEDGKAWDGYADEDEGFYDNSDDDDEEDEASLDDKYARVERFIKVAFPDVSRPEIQRATVRFFTDIPTSCRMLEELCKVISEGM